MGKAARNRRSRQQQSRAAERLQRRGSTGPLRGGSAEARELLAKVSAETEMPCRATFMDDPLFGGHPATVTGITPEGGLITETGGAAGRIPVLLFEPVHALAVKDGVTGLMHEARTDGLVGAGWQRVPPQFIMAGLPADGWGLYRTGAGVELRDPYGCTFAEGHLVLDPEWVSAAVSARSVMVLVGPRLGVRVPPGRSPESYTDRDRAREFREGRQYGLLAAATVKWHSTLPAETVSWELLAENTLGPQSPPVAYVPLLNLKAHGGPQAFGFTDLSRFGSGPLEIPVTPDLAARLTGTDVDLIRPDDDTGGFVAGYLNTGGPGDERFATWRASAARHGRILVITGSQELLPAGEDTGFAPVLEVVRASHGALVPLTRESARQAAAPEPQTTETADSDDMSEYSELLTTKLRSLDSFEVYISHTVKGVIDRDSLGRWLTNLWPVTCQTCSEPLGTKADISVDGPTADNKVLVSMHHSACRPSGVTPSQGVTMHRPTFSFVAGYLTTPGRAPRATDIPVMVVNPSCEQLLLERDGTGGWRNATLDEFTSLGLCPATGDFPPDTKQIQAELRDGRLTITIGADSPASHHWAIAPPPHVCDQLRHHRGFAISLTTKALPALLTPEDLPGAFADPEAVTGWVNLVKPARPRRWPALHLPQARTAPPQAKASTGDPG